MYLKSFFRFELVGNCVVNLNKKWEFVYYIFQYLLE
jgi:hypothetical protein